MQFPRPSLSNNIQLNDIVSAVNSNNSISHSDHLKTQLNDAARNQQNIHLEEKFIQFNQSFKNASDSARAHILQELEHGIHRLNQEECNIINIQDPPMMQGRRTYRRGGKRLQTRAQIADKELLQQQKTAEKEARHEQNGILSNS